MSLDASKTTTTSTSVSTTTLTNTVNRQTSNFTPSTTLSTILEQTTTFTSNTSTNTRTSPSSSSSFFPYSSEENDRRLKVLNANCNLKLNNAGNHKIIPPPVGLSSSLSSLFSPEMSWERFNNPYYHIVNGSGSSSSATSAAVTTTTASNVAQNRIRAAGLSMPSFATDEEDEDLCNNIGLLTESCVDQLINNQNVPSSLTSSGVASAPLLALTTNSRMANIYGNISLNHQKAIQNTVPPTRSWNVKLQATRDLNRANQQLPLGFQVSQCSGTVISTPTSNTIGTSLPPTAPTNTTTSTNFSSKCYKQSTLIATGHNGSIADENYNFVSVEHADTSFPVFLELWENRQVCDVVITVGEKKFSAHRIILCATIPYFYAMFTNDLAERTQTEVVLQTDESGDGMTPSLEVGAFESLLRYAYTGSITINSRNVQSILIGASFLGLTNVQQACADYLKIRLNVSNVLNLKCFALALGCDTLVDASKRFIHHHFEEISKTEDFLNLDFDEVVDIVDKDELNIRGEEIVFEAILNWTKRNEDKRLESLPLLLSHVRLSLLSPEYLCDSVMSEKLIRNSLQCRDLVDEAKDFHLMPQRRELMQRLRTRQRFGHHIQGLIYAVGGLTKNGDSMSTVEVYDPQTKRWRIAEAMTMLRSRVGVEVMDGKLYAIGGYNGKERLNTVEVYHSRLKRWTKVTSMGYRRSAVGAASLNGYLYVCGGYDGVTSLNAVERYSATSDRWDLMPSMNLHRSAAGVVAFDGYIYALGGHDGLMIFNSVERYDPRTNEWEMVEPMLTSRCRLGVATFGGKIYVCGGYDGCTFLQSAEVYDPNTGKWSYISPMRVTRSRVALVANCGQLFAIGGYDGISNLSSVEIYDIERDCWEFTSSMVAHEGGVGVGVIPDN